MSTRENGWHYSVADGTSEGPVSLLSLRQAVHLGNLRADDLVWHESLGAWKQITNIAELSPYLAASAVPPRQQTPTPPTIVPPPVKSPNDTWGAVGSVALAISGGLLLVGLCFTPMSCCAVPVSIGGITSAMFSDDNRLRRIALIGNSIVLFLSLAIVLWVAVSFSMELQKLQ